MCWGGRRGRENWQTCLVLEDSIALLGNCVFYLQERLLLGDVARAQLGGRLHVGSFSGMSEFSGLSVMWLLLCKGSLEGGELCVRREVQVPGCVLQDG